jgi:hypothetical protein
MRKNREQVEQRTPEISEAANTKHARTGATLLLQEQSDYEVGGRVRPGDEVRHAEKQAQRDARTLIDKKMDFVLRLASYLALEP